MFAKTIIDSDAFLDMPSTTQLLYFHLSMRADDEGFINKPKSIMRICGCKDDDLKVLFTKNFVIPFESGVVVIKHWKIHNYIRNDRLKETVYNDEKSQLTIKENETYTVKSKYKRLQEYNNSDLPCSFGYKMREAFIGEICPVCKREMGVSDKDESGIMFTTPYPTIQHNVPISKGGKHEISNISIICESCNKSIKDTETGELNNKKVIEVWNKISMSDKCQSSVSIGKDRLGKDRLEETRLDKNIYGEFENVKLSNIELEKLKEKFSDYQEKIESLSGYIKSKGVKYKDHYATILNWARKEEKEKPKVKEVENDGNGIYDYNKLFE